MIIWKTYKLQIWKTIPLNGFAITNEKIKESIGTIPVIKSWELKEFENSKELLKMIKERKEN